MDFYQNCQSNTFDHLVNVQELDISANQTKTEWISFKPIMLLKQREFKESLDISVTVAYLDKEQDMLTKK